LKRILRFCCNVRKMGSRDWGLLLTSIAPPGLCVVAGLMVGYFWGHTLLGPATGPMKRLSIGNSLSGVFTVTGPLVLSKWSAVPTALAGVAWVTGILIGVVFCIARSRKSLVTSLVGHCDEAYRPRIDAFVRAHLLRDGLNETERLTLEWLKKDQTIQLDARRKVVV
jgi:hypothetical protein